MKLLNISNSITKVKSILQIFIILSKLVNSEFFMTYIKLNSYYN